MNSKERKPRDPFELGIAIDDLITDLHEVADWAKSIEKKTKAAETKSTAKVIASQLEHIARKWAPLGIHAKERTERRFKESRSN